MLFHGQAVKQDIVLRTQPKALPDAVDVVQDGVAIDDGVARCRWEEAGQDGHGGCLAGTVVAEQSRDLPLEHGCGQVVHCQFAAN